MSQQARKCEIVKVAKLMGKIANVKLLTPSMQTSYNLGRRKYFSFLDGLFSLSISGTNLTSTLSTRSDLLSVKPLSGLEIDSLTNNFYKTILFQRKSKLLQIYFHYESRINNFFLGTNLLRMLLWHSIIFGGGAWRMCWWSWQPKLELKITYWSQNKGKGLLSTHGGAKYSKVGGPEAGRAWGPSQDLLQRHPKAHM